MKLSHAINSESGRFIPFTNTRYSVDGKGTITDHRFNEIVAGITSDNKIIEIETSEGIFIVKHATIVAVTRKLYVYHPKFWIDIDVMFIDNNTSNKDARNLVIKFPKGGLLYKEGFYLIPGLSRYAIAKNGTVLDLISNKTKRICITNRPMSYPSVSVVPDMYASRNIALHRLLAFSFLEYPVNVDILDVNHLDGNKNNFSLDNLEWVTRQQNCQHAYENGLRNDNVPTLVRNVFTGEVTWYYSIEEAARKNNIDGETVRLRIKTPGYKIYPPGLQFKLESDKNDWIIYEDVNKELNRNGLAKLTKVTCNKTGEEKIFKSSGEAARYLKILPYIVRWHLARKPKYVREDVTIEYMV